jgi:hypothetical protein
MPKFKKKPVVIEAFQMTPERRWDNSEWPNWLHEAWQKDPSDPGCLYCVRDDGSVGPGEHLRIATLEGHHAVTPFDWIIQGVHGELYPCKPDIFKQTYEAVDELA